jgi:hypothetical protein
MAEYKQSSYAICKGIKQAKHQYSGKVDSQFNGSDIRRMCKELQTITDYKVKNSHIADTDVLLPDKPITFARYEDNTLPPRGAALVLCGRLKHLSMLTLARLPTQIASLYASSEQAQTCWLECLRTYLISSYSSLLSLHASRCPLLFLYPRKQW